MTLKEFLKDLDTVATYLYGPANKLHRQKGHDARDRLVKAYADSLGKAQVAIEQRDEARAELERSSR